MKITPESLERRWNSYSMLSCYLGVGYTKEHYENYIMRNYAQCLTQQS
jgi:hypothetical protein